LGEAADVDLAIRLRQAGFHTVVEPESIVQATPLDAPLISFRRGLSAERLLLRNTPSLARTALLRPLALAGGFCLRAIHPLRAVGYLAGQLCAWCALPGHLRYRRSLSGLADQAAALQHAAAEGASDRPNRPLGTRLDAGHAASSPRIRSGMRVAS